MAINTTAPKRIMREMAIVKEDNPCIVAASPVDPRDPLKWVAFIRGPADSVYEGGIFELAVTFPPNYPFIPPKVDFVTAIYHCNIFGKSICIDILKNQWSPALTIDKVLLSITSLLSDPNPQDPLNREVASKYLHEREEHDRIAREWTRKHAMNHRKTQEKILSLRDGTWKADMP